MCDPLNTKRPAPHYVDIDSRWLCWGASFYLWSVIMSLCHEAIFTCSGSSEYPTNLIYYFNPEDPVKSVFSTVKMPDWVSAFRAFLPLSSLFSNYQFLNPRAPWGSLGVLRLKLIEPFASSYRVWVGVLIPLCSEIDSKAENLAQTIRSEECPLTAVCIWIMTAWNIKDLSASSPSKRSFAM